MNERLYNFKCYMEDDFGMNKLKHIFLIGKEIEQIELSGENVNTLIEYGHKNIYYNFDDKFNVDYINNFLTDFKFYSVWGANKNKITKFKINSTKTKELETITVNNTKDLLDILVDVDLIHGKSALLKNLNTKIAIFNKKISKIEIVENIEKIIMLNNHKELRELMDNMSNPSYDDKLVFGYKDAKKYTEMCIIKRLFIHVRGIDKFRDELSDYINYEIIPIKRLEPGDIATTLSKDFGGVFGELYYAFKEY